MSADRIQQESGTFAVRDRSHETTAAGISWTQFHQCRVHFRHRWRTVWDVPISNGIFNVVTSKAASIESVLDVGATTRVWEKTVRTLWPMVEYRSLDIDRTHAHDYYSFAEIDRQFDLVTCIEVLEHMPPALGLELLKQCVERCRRNGLALITVPNVLTPGAQLEFTHQTAFSHLDLAGLLKWVGLDVLDAVRICLFPTRRRILHERLLMPAHRLLNVDFCQMIGVLARRP